MKRLWRVIVSVLGSYVLHVYLGLALVAVGAGMITKPAGYVAAGAGLFYLGAWYGRGGKSE